MPGVTYVVLATADDGVVTPYTDSFLPAAPGVPSCATVGPVIGNV